MDSVSKSVRSRIMSSIRSKHTKPEIAIRRLLSKMSLKYKLHYGKEKIDVALPSRRLAIFVDGCFWHQCPRHSHLPKSSLDYWLPKMKRNILRAKLKDSRLKAKDWKIVHFWEHDIANVQRIRQKLEIAIDKSSRKS